MCASTPEWLYKFFFEGHKFYHFIINIRDCDKIFPKYKKRSQQVFLDKFLDKLGISNPSMILFEKSILKDLFLKTL